MIITAFSVLTTVVILAVYHHSPNTPVPKWMCMVVFNIIGTILFCHTKEHFQNSSSINSVDDMKVTKLEKDNKLLENTLPHEIMALCNRYLNKYESDEQVEQNRENWQRVARILDRLFFIVFFIAITVLTLYVFTTLRKEPLDTGV